MIPPDPRRRPGDSIAIPGDYQARALNSTRKAQRFWHSAKFRLIERVAQPGPDDRVLDAGCGSGTISHFLAQSAGSVVAIDSNLAAIEFARATYREPNLSFLHGQFDEIRNQGCFDRIYCVEVLEHLYLEQAVAVLTLFHDVAASASQLFITTPNYRSTWPLIEKVLDLLHLVPKLDTDQHVTHFSRRRLIDACRKAGWSVTVVGGFNGLAPFLAPVSNAFALTWEKLEYRLRYFLPQNLLFCVCTKVESLPA